MYSVEAVEQEMPMNANPPRTKAAQRAQTRRTLIQVARSQFGQYGYAQTAAEDLVRIAGVTRGALYHHFDSKEGLFRAVLEDVQQDVARRIDAAVADLDDPWAQLLAGCRAFLAASLDAEVQRIMLIDGPATLGWEAWREIDAEQSMSLLGESIHQLVATGVISVPSVEATVHLLSGAMNEAALWIAQVEQPRQALAEAIASLEHLLAGLRRADTT
jgi:AcrR family transcriptional regulator